MVFLAIDTEIFFSKSTVHAMIKRRPRHALIRLQALATGRYPLLSGLIRACSAQVKVS